MKHISHVLDPVSEISNELKAELWQRSADRNYKAGDIVVFQGNPVREVYRLESGKAKISSYTENGREIILSKISAGDTFGDTAVLDGMPSAYNVECSTDCVLRVLPSDEFLALYQQYPEYAYGLCHKYNRQVRVLYELLVEARAMPLQKRLVSMLFRGYHTHTSSNQKGRYLDLSQDELASMLGTVRQSINRELKKLEAGGYLDIIHGKVYLTNIDKLRNDHKDIIHDNFLTPYKELQRQ
ncbi:Crp/Fnr family transcriptional regulator [Bacterioplanoides sp.]|uniref:Crp/Fnr family transcriptional regulator n=1 Tax=Bacterioplanoides sp. TaxID=2066072 RepID=UPI003B009CAC